MKKKKKMSANSQPTVHEQSFHWLDNKHCDWLLFWKGNWFNEREFDSKLIYT